jgi:amino acid adenylation domain-containing protein
MTLMVLDRVAAMAAEDPGRPAVRARDGSLSFAELAERADAVACALVKYGIGPERRVAVSGGRSRWFVPSLLAVWLVGAVAVPLDDRHPLDRRGHVVRDSGAVLVLGNSDLDTTLPVLTAEECAAGEIPVVTSHPDQCAYTIYTSGTTGRPKGVEVTYRGLNTFLGALAGLHLPSGGAGINAVSPAFDGWLWCTLLYLMHGQTVAVVDVADDAAALLGEQIAAVAPRTVSLTPSLYSVCEAAARAAEVLVVAGELCPPSLAERLADGRRVLNVYGPTETTIAATWADTARGDDPRTIGRALDGYLSYVLDPSWNPAETGELFIGGPGVARGYAGLSGLTAARFVPDPFGEPGARMYRTGDLVRRRPDGLLDYLGRTDSQVKVHGTRIELAEVEAVATRLPGIGAAVCVLISPDTLGLAVVRDHMAGTADCGKGAGDIADQVRAHCRLALPLAAVPARVIVVDEMPATTTGKADRGRIAAMLAEEPVDRGARTPSTRHEREVQTLWSELLGVPVVDVEGDFFEIGGHSLLAATMVAALRRRTGLPVSMRHLLTQPTVAGLAEQLDQMAAHGRGDAP